MPRIHCLGNASGVMELLRDHDPMLKKLESLPKVMQMECMGAYLKSQRSSEFIKNTHPFGGLQDCEIYILAPPSPQLLTGKVGVACCPEQITVRRLPTILCSASFSILCPKLFSSFKAWSVICTAAWTMISRALTIACACCFWSMAAATSGAYDRSVSSNERIT